MAFFFNSSFTINAIICLLTLCGASIAGAAMDPRFELDPLALPGSRSSSKKPAVKSEKRTSPSRVVKAPSPRSDKLTIPSSAVKTPSPPSGKQGAVYTVKPGDGLIKILMRYYGLSFDKARASIEDIKRENNIVDVNRIRIGQKITFSLARRRADGWQKLNQAVQAESKSTTTAETAGLSFKLESPVPMLSEQEAVSRIRETWDRIVPVKSDMLKPPDLETSSFSLTLDAERYPTFTAMDGGRIIIDQGGTISPLVKSLLLEKEPSLRIVSDSPSGTKGFISSMLGAGGFYSVEENFNMDFGVDPKLSFHADFKIEKTTESLGKQDIVLMNSGLGATPHVLVEFLKKEGFSLYEPFAFLKQQAVFKPKPLYLITAKKQSEIVDAILKAFSIVPDRDRRLDVFAADNSGISLAVKAGRYFERGGQRFVITGFDGASVNNSLFKILETKGLRVIILEAQDDFRKVSEKILSRMKMNTSFASYNLLQNSSANYSIQMSGFKLDDPDLPGGGLFLTNLEMDPIIGALLTENGYSINGR